MLQNRNYFRNLLIFCFPFFLAACGGKIVTDRQYCPTEGVLADTERLSVMPHGSQLGNQRGRIARITGTILDCKMNIDTQKLAVSMTLRGAVLESSTKGGVMEVTLPVFAIIIDRDDKILQRNDFDIAVRLRNGRLLPNDVIRYNFTYHLGTHVLSLAEGMSAKNYTVLVGFRLTEAQLQENRISRSKKLGL